MYQIFILSNDTNLTLPMETQRVIFLKLYGFIDIVNRFL